MMSETDSELTTDELKELAADAMDTVDCGSSRTVGHRLRVFVKDGEVRVKAKNSSLYARASISHPEKEALDEAGLQWEHKTDRRFSDDINPSVVIVTGVSESDGGDSDTEGGEGVTEGEDPDGEDADSTPVYRDGEGGFTDDRMADAWFWAAQADGWMTDGPNAGLEGHYYVTVLAGQAVIVLDGEKFDHESNVTALVSALHDYDFPASITSREMETANETRIFIEPDDTRLSSYYVDEWREWEPDSEFSDTEPGHELMTDGGEDETTEDSATEHYRRALANRSDEYPDDPEDISDADVFEAARDDVTDSDGELIIRFGADTDGKTNLEVTPGPFRKYYRPNHILMEQCGLSEGVDAALSRLTEALDLRTVPRVRLGTFRVDGDSGRVTAVNLHRNMFEFSNSEDHPDTLELEMRHLANGYRDEDANPGGGDGGTAMTDGGEDVEPRFVYVRGPAHLADGADDTFAICGVARQGTPTHRIGDDDPLQDYPDLCGNCRRVLRSRRDGAGGEGGSATPEGKPMADGGEDAVIPYLSVGDDVTLGINTFPASKGGEMSEKISGTVEETSHERALAEAGGYHGTVVIDSEGSTYTVAYNPFDARVARGKTDRPAEVSFGAVVSAETP